MRGAWAYKVRSVLSGRANRRGDLVPKAHELAMLALKGGGPNNR